MSENSTMEGLPGGFPSIENPKYWRGPRGFGPDDPDYDPDKAIFYVRDYIRDVREWFEERETEHITVKYQSTEVECDKCPVCGSGGCRAVYGDPLLNKDVTHFYCDDDRSHHFLIVHLEPYEVEEMEEPA